ncbi:uncharacterized protein TNCV_3298691 [Trichonephila clavipes]|uniref:Uncharacterized protein n=1 Tax=Trichonephila clavipes TaxID=2585209 RepID=A0A8X6VTM1_TRICX|nr:uncharacterized protein TNCV_3298691 [Trichonephila clavipes]
MEARLRALKNNLKSTKLSDNKPISGRGRLTDAEILLLQKYYGLAIRRNVGENQSQICPNPSGQYISINCRQMKIHNMLCALWEQKVGAGTIKALYQASTLVKAFRKIDYVRICEAEMAVQKASKEARTTKRQIKRKQDALEHSMQDEYSAVNF